jgi:hypothetical protein
LKVTAELNLEKEKFEESKRLERQKLDADPVKLALQASGINGAETLGFMVQTNLIEDAEIRKGVIAYLDSKKPVPPLQTEPTGIEKERALLSVESPDGKGRATAFLDGCLRLTDTATNKSRPIMMATDTIAMSFSTDSRRLIVVGYDNTGEVLEATGARIGLIALKGLPDSVKFEDDGKIWSREKMSILAVFFYVSWLKSCPLVRGSGR